ncbi:MAG: hypothetical protein AAFY80_11500 [Pseudomonadota bacterium]
MSFLRTKNVEISSIASIFSVLTLIFGAWQFYLAREAVQAQAIGSSLAHGRDLYTDLSNSPDIALELFGANEASLGSLMFVQRTLSFFSEQYIYYENWLIEKDTWIAVREDLCTTYRSPGFQVYADATLSVSSYSKGFVEVIEGCTDG